LPFIILDYPRQFSKHSIFAYRTMFWWGNFISFTLHLQGRAFNSYKKKILSRYNILRKGKFFICVNKAQWDHRYESTNYRLVGKLSAAEFASEINGKSFLKISKKIELPEIVGNSNVMATVTRFGLATYQELLQMIK
ncbi:MAG: hypothetical protein IIA45_12910, partial [Bacteroidetes bacterium]|nr:hypothetical protein [Bacteroidota bacterium]